LAKDIYDRPDASTLPGYEAHPDGNGYFFKAADGKNMAMRGAGPKDRVFRSEKFGLLNISKALDAIKREKGRPIRKAIDAQLIKHISLVEYDLQYVLQMTEKQSNEPIIMVIAGDGANVIDGHHRLRRRIFDNKPYVKAHILRPETVRYMQVQVYKEVADGEFVREIGLTDEELEREINEGAAMADKIAQMNGIDQTRSR
jgi:hypothetical protein